MEREKKTCKLVVMLGVSMGLTAITGCKTSNTLSASLPNTSIPEEQVTSQATPSPVAIEADGNTAHEQADTTIINAAVVDKPVDGIYGENSDIPDFIDPPTYPGGQAALSQFLSDNIKYPKEAEKNSIQGRVLVGFIVDVDGAISESRIEHSSHTLLDREALRVIRQMPAWNPAKEKASGKPVKVRYHLPVTFKL